MARKKTPRTLYVAYNKRTGIPWAAGEDEGIVADYADANELDIKPVTWLEATQ